VVTLKVSFAIGFDKDSVLFIFDYEVIPSYSYFLVYTFLVFDLTNPFFFLSSAGGGYTFFYFYYLAFRIS